MSFKQKFLETINIGFLLNKKLDRLQLAIGRIEQRQLEILKNEDPVKNEFQVTSQWGEDGIIQYLIQRIEIPNKLFVEFGVQDYAEANTRFLLQNNNWSGLIIDSCEEDIRSVKKDKMYWKYNLKAITSFVTAENINEILQENGIEGDIGLLSIDIDGNDYWVWEAIDCISPRIVIVEYNSMFGPVSKVSIPYDPSFFRGVNNLPMTYFGSSISALSYLGKRKGYELICSNSAGSNAFFVRKDLLTDFNNSSLENKYFKPYFRESRDKSGQLTFNSFDTCQKEMAELKLIDVETNMELLFKEIP